MDTTRRVLLVSGSLRAGSTNSALLRTAVALAPAGVEAVFFDGLDRLPHFDPDQDTDPLHPAVESLRAAIRGCDAMLFSTPEYAGALPGAFKNLLEWSVGDANAGSIYEKPVGWVNVSAAPAGAADAYESLTLDARNDIEEGTDAFLQVDAGDSGADAAVRPVGEGQVWVRCTGGIEAVRLAEDSRLSVRRAQWGDDGCRRGRWRSHRRRWWRW